MRRLRLISFLFVLCACAMQMVSQRLPVLKQIDLPHSYYYREMYLPLLTSGPSGAAWMPIKPGAPREIIFSMQGCLWRQSLNSTSAAQLAAGPGYDYQPDVSPDGKWVVYSKYDHDAIELWLLNLSDHSSSPLTQDSAVNVEPRWSPDGKRIAYVSTSGTGHLHIFILDFDEWQQHNLNNAPLGHPVIQRLTGETRSSLPRYYYSAVDHEISPTWSADGREIIYISNHGHIHGTGGFWRMKSHIAEQPKAAPVQMPRGPFGRMQNSAAPPAQDAGREIRYEETTWKARPDWSPDGKRVAYGSYLGREWHQLWAMPPEGGDVLPLTYGDFDAINPRWSPDGNEIAFISNKSGNTQLCVQEFRAASVTCMAQRDLKYMKKMATLQLKVLGDGVKPTSARVFVTGEDGRAYAPQTSWIHADDSFDRKERPFEAHYFDVDGNAFITVPPGKVTVEIMKGFDHIFEHKVITAEAGRTSQLTVQLRPLTFGAETGKWASGDVHVHMNYAGTYRATPSTLLRQMQAENLNVVQNLIVNKEQRFPDIAYADRLGKIDPASTANFQILHGQEFHTSYWGHLGLLHLTKNIVIPGYAGYPNTVAASTFPTNAAVADMAHAQGALVGYVHPFDELPDPARDANLSNELPVDVALGKVDYYEVLGFSDHKSSAAIWYKLLNLGFRIPAAAGTDAMTNYASLRGPVGLNRVFVKTSPGPLNMDAWLDGLKHGRTFASNGPLLRFTLGGQFIGGELDLPAAQSVKFTASLRSIVPVDNLEIVCNGDVVLKLTKPRSTADATGKITVPRSGWCLLRAWAEKPEYPILDLYPYATTSPIYVKVGGKAPSSPEDAKFFVAWIDRLIENAGKHPGYNSDAEKTEVMGQLQKARDWYSARASAK